MVIRHQCNNPRCININHMSIGSQADNIQDMVDAGRNCFGERHPRAKLTEHEVVQILDAQNISSTKLAAKYGVTTTTISKIRNHKGWKHITSTRMLTRSETYTTHNGFPYFSIKVYSEVNTTFWKGFMRESSNEEDRYF